MPSEGVWRKDRIRKTYSTSFCENRNSSCSGGELCLDGGLIRIILFLGTGRRTRHSGLRRADWTNPKAEEMTAETGTGFQRK